LIALQLTTRAGDLDAKATGRVPPRISIITPSSWPTEPAWQAWRTAAWEHETILIWCPCHRALHHSSGASRWPPHQELHCGKSAS